MKKVVVDSDAIFALYNPNDPLNEQAIKTFEELVVRQDYQLIYPTSVIFEIISFFQRVLPTPIITSKLIDMIKIDMIKDEQLLIQTVDNTLLKEAALLFDPYGSKKNTLIDCSVVAVAKKIKADCVFAYDNFYAKHNLISAEVLLVASKTPGDIAEQTQETEK